MKLLIGALILTFYVLATLAAVNSQDKRVVCFWNSTSFRRSDPVNFNFTHLNEALTLCTHFVYGYAGVNTTTGEVAPINRFVDFTPGLKFYDKILKLKQNYPNVKFLLGIGGGADPPEETHKYLTVIETPESRRKFVDSAVQLLNRYKFDGFDLAWQFPTTRIPIDRNVFSSFWQGTKSRLGYGKFHDKKEALHRDGFTILVYDLHEQLRNRNKILSLSILPHVNASIYYDIESLAPNVDFINLWSFDKKTPLRNPKSADVTSPIYENFNGIADDHLDKDVTYWSDNGAPKDKLVLAIATFGRSWKVSEESHQNNYRNPVSTDGEAPPGPFTRTPGFLSYLEICSRYKDKDGIEMIRQMRPFEGFQYFLINPIKERRDKVTESIWVGYEEPITAADKGFYARSVQLGGIAIVDISLDDFTGACSGGVAYPILREARHRYLNF